MSAPLLEIDRLQKHFMGLRALDEVSFTLEKSAITSLIGPNGAGKTTLFNCITGMYAPSGGAVRFEGQEIGGLGAYAISRRGVARTFQNLALFGGLTVLENVVVGAYSRGRTGLLQGAFLSPRARREQREAESAARETLAFLGLEDTADLTPTELSYGRQKQIEFGRALMQRGRLLLLDEPMAGMSDAEKADMTKLIKRARADLGLTILIVEHDIPVIMNISDKIVVLDFGRKISEGTPREVRADPAVIAAYLGDAA
jgi:ABC-type branched-subunit amino acid transport system ATPase component